MTDRVLSLRQLNRATLARQMLLTRQPLPAAAAVERLVGLQAQLARPPYVGLWTRLRDFHREDLAACIESREVLKATWVRGTLHLLTAEDYTRFRAALQPMLTKGWSAIAKRRGGGFEPEEVLMIARRALEEAPRTFAELSALLGERLPGLDVGAMRYAVRTHLPLVQVPESGGWSYPSKPAFALAEGWLGRPIAAGDDLRPLVPRYLAAFGPAAVTDMQTWSGLAGLKPTFEQLRGELATCRDERRRELFDLPDLEPPDADQPAPVRFLPEFDNLLLSHRDRSRVIAEEHRSKVFLPGLRVAATFLVDGFVAGTWKIEATKKAAALLVQPFSGLARQDQAALAEEGERLLRFAEPRAGSFDVRLAEPS